MLAVFAVALAVFAVTYAAEASYGTSAPSDPRTGPLYEIGSQLTSYLHENGYADEMPFFWYDSSYDGGLYASLQSLYYFGYTYVGLDLPRVDQDFRSRMNLYQPTRLVLLCTEAGCHGAQSALTRAGYTAMLVRETPARGAARPRVGGDLRGEAHCGRPLRSVTRPVARAGLREVTNTPQLRSVATRARVFDRRQTCCG